jgi:hypothetical protein
MTSNFVENQELIEVQCLLRRSCGRESPEVIVLTVVLFVAFDHLFLFFVIVQLCTPSVRRKGTLLFYTQETVCQASIICLLHSELFAWSVLIYLSIYLYICLSVSLKTFVGPWSLSSFLIFYSAGRTPWTGDQPVTRPLPANTGQRKHRININRYPCLE